MLLYIRHEHTEQLCPALDPDLMNSTFKMVLSEEHRKKCNVKLLSAYIDGPGHTVFLIVGADDMADVVKFLLPLNKIGKGEVRPVIDASDLTRLMSMEG